MEKRLVNSEWNTLLMFASFASHTADLVDGFKSRLDLVDNGMERATKLRDEAMSLFADILETVTLPQKKKLRGVMDDFKILHVPALSKDSSNIILTQEQVKQLIDMVQERCLSCVEESDEAQKCPVYQLLEALTPLNSYDTITCPYSLAKWGDPE